MHRRNFLASSLAAAALPIDASQANGSGREYYELRRYQLHSGPQQKLANNFVENALIPALNRLGIKPVGAFNLEIGVETPALYVLMPSTSLETLARSELQLAEDAEYQKAGEAFLKAPAIQPPYSRIESTLLIAFEGHPRLTVPPPTAEHGARVFQLRTYESPSNSDHRIKVEMFHSGEFGAFQRAGFWQVFYGDALIGSRLPHLTYMLSFPDIAEMNAKWKAFGADPEWQKLLANPKFNFESIVSNITNLILNPASYSQI
ncbi:MAG: NIPSNAP family protein [Acidobacteriaceae bacterium]|nr:NIPSNAP family protein [Acidobacteriaceae bacterium]